MKKPYQNTFAKAISNLPQFTPDDQVWKHIETALIKEKDQHSLKKAIGELPFFDAPEDILDKVQVKTKKYNTIHVILKIGYVSAIAASLMLGILLFQDLFIQKQEFTTYYSEEITSENQLNRINTKDEELDPLEAMIARKCLELQDICLNPKFSYFHQELEKLEKEQNKIQDLIDSNGDEQLQKYYIRIQNEKIKIQKEFLKELRIT